MGGVEGISLYFSGCTVSHGSSAIAVIKDSCFSETLNAEPRASEGLTTSFSFRVFKGKGESAPSQTIQCSVVICKDDDDTLVQPRATLTVRQIPDIIIMPKHNLSISAPN